MAGPSLKERITELRQAINTKTNELHATKEEASNKKQNLVSVNPEHYASIPAINAGLAATEQAANNYTDQEINALDPDSLVNDPNYVHTDNNFTTPLRTKLEGLESSKFKGEFQTLAALEAAVPNPGSGDYANVDGGVGEPVVRYVWDNNDESWEPQVGESTQLTGSQVKQLYESQPDTNAYTDSEKAAREANTTNIANIDGDLQAYKAEVGEDFPNYAEAFLADLNF